MSVLDHFFVPREEILKLTNRSFEHLAVRLETALAGEAKRLFEGNDAQVLGTFPGRVVVITDAGKVFNLAYEETASGEVRFLTAEPVSAKVYSKASLPQFVRKEASEVAGLFIRGSSEEATKRLRLLTRLVDERGSYDEEKAVDAFTRTVLTSSAWKKLFAERQQEFDGLLEESQTQPLAQKLRAKFFKLYDGSIEGTASEQYRGLVVEDIKHLDGRLSAVLQTGVASVQRLRDVAEKNDLSGNETFATLGSFAEDLVSDTRRVRSSLLETVQGVEKVGSLGRIFDTLAEELSRYERAGAVLSEMTCRLAAAE